MIVPFAPPAASERDFTYGVVLFAITPMVSAVVSIRIMVDMSKSYCCVHYGFGNHKVHLTATSTARIPEVYMRWMVPHQDGLKFSKSLPPALTVNYLASIEAVSPVMATLKSVDYFNDRLPNEIILEILSGLKKKDLKRARFTCKKLASLGGQILVVNLYLSPREKDMAVFDAVTQHPHLRKSVKNIIFDSAYFPIYTLETYVQLNRRIFVNDLFFNLGQAKSTIQEMYAMLQPRYGRSYELSSDELEELGRQFMVKEGYRLHRLHAQEQGNILLDSCRISICTNLASHMAPTDDPRPLMLHQIGVGDLQNDNGDTAGCIEFLKFVKLLSTTGKQPFRFQARTTWTGNYRWGLPLDVFDGKKSPESVHFSYLSNRLKVLDLALAFHTDSSTEELFADFSILKRVFQKASSLAILKLYLPYNDGDGSNWDLINVNQLFPPVAGLALPNLTILQLAAISFSYYNLASLLFHSLPNLISLYLQKTILWEGKWQDIIEGLRCLKQLKSCEMSHMRHYTTEEYHYYYAEVGSELWGSNDFDHQNGQYVVGIIDRHPSLKEGQPNSASAKYMARLNEALKEIRASQT
ncbi:MAG: hypothetical protein Q9204_005268 [Flavoplaca sp. TL-2023a]